MKTKPDFQVILADLSLPDHQRAVLDLTDAYSGDPFGDGAPLAADAKQRLIPGLQRHPTTLIFLAFEKDKPIGIANCFVGFSTFRAKPLINIHDFFVLPEFRGRGVGKALLAAVERHAIETGCCKLTLEVQSNNHRARTIYESFGFSQAVYQEAAGGSLFLTKRL